MGVCVTGSGFTFNLAGRGSSRPMMGGFNFCISRLPTDPIGNFALTLTNLVVGSAIQIEDQAHTMVIHYQVCDNSIETINIPAYAFGMPLNNLRIKVRKGSAPPYYQPYETLATAFVGSQTIYVSQIPDE